MMKSLLENCLAEGRWMLAFWLASFAWVIGYSLYFGTNAEQGEISIVAGVPAWVFWGIGLPWGLATAFSIWFALTQMKDDPLDADIPDETNSKP